MRIIAGKFRSRRLLSPKDAETTRPIPDRVKESVFNLLRGRFEGASVLDCFAGTGAIGLEAISRGAERVVFVERDRRAGDLLQRNIDMLEAGDQAELLRADALGPAALARCPKPVNMVFLDPPYPLVLEPEGWARVSRQISRLAEYLSDDGFVILRTPWPFRHVTVINAEGHIVPSGDPRNPFDYRGKVRKDLPPPSGKKYKGRRETISARDDDEEDERETREWIGDEIDVERIQEESNAELDAANNRPDHGVPGGFKIERHDVDLVIPGTKGPESHTYASQAVHLYMKA